MLSKIHDFESFFFHSFVDAGIDWLLLRHCAITCSKLFVYIFPRKKGGGGGGHKNTGIHAHTHTLSILTFFHRCGFESGQQKQQREWCAVILSPAAALKDCSITTQPSPHSSNGRVSALYYYTAAMQCKNTLWFSVVVVHCFDTRPQQQRRSRRRRRVVLTRVYQ